MRLRLGGAFPDGWTKPSPVLSIRWPFIKYFPIQWIERRMAEPEDIRALKAYLGPYMNYDKLSVVGKANAAYTTEKAEYLKGRQ